MAQSSTAHRLKTCVKGLHSDLEIVWVKTSGCSRPVSAAAARLPWTSSSAVYNAAAAAGSGVVAAQVDQLLADE